mmetsp:Transcript_7448/g.27318  ORF Transcript_7448/g.27318 Transcript_7448/m.27318 type:complete len:337 (+) Transcript_7448:107-1117(+)
MCLASRGTVGSPQLRDRHHIAAWRQPQGNQCLHSGHRQRCSTQGRTVPSPSSTRTGRARRSLLLRPLLPDLALLRVPLVEGVPPLRLQAVLRRVRARHRRRRRRRSPLRRAPHKSICGAARPLRAACGALVLLIVLLLLLLLIIRLLAPVMLSVARLFEVLPRPALRRRRRRVPQFGGLEAEPMQDLLSGRPRRNRFCAHLRGLPEHTRRKTSATAASWASGPARSAPPRLHMAPWCSGGHGHGRRRDATVRRAAEPGARPCSRRNTKRHMSSSSAGCDESLRRCVPGASPSTRHYTTSSGWTKALAHASSHLIRLAHSRHQGACGMPREPILTPP